MKINGAKIIHAQFRGARKFMILRCFKILYVQILSGFKNWDIQDLRFFKILYVQILSGFKN